MTTALHHLRPPSAAPHNTPSPPLPVRGWGGQVSPGGAPGRWALRPQSPALVYFRAAPHLRAPPPPPRVTVRRVVAPLRGPWTVTRSSLRMLRRVAAFCRLLRPVLLPVSFPRSRSPVVGVPGLC